MTNNGFFTKDFKVFVNLSVPKSHLHRKGEVVNIFKVLTNDKNTVHVAMVRYKDSTIQTVVMDKDDNIPEPLPFAPGKETFR